MAFTSPPPDTKLLQLSIRPHLKSIMLPCSVLFSLGFFFLFFLFIPFYFFLFFLFYCCSITVVCIFSPPQPNPDPSPASTLPLSFVHVSFIVVPENPSPHCPFSPPSGYCYIFLNFNVSGYILFAFLLLLIMFLLKVRMYGICPSQPGLFHLA